LKVTLLILDSAVMKKVLKTSGDLPQFKNK
jgi:hypothetical protein